MPLEIVEATGSTNADLLARLAAGEAVAEGGWLVARRQLAGRGRLGRAWESRDGNFSGSTTVALRGGDPMPASLTFVAALAAHDAVVDATRGQTIPLIKWPNDLLVSGAKLAGILLERQGDAVVVGLGINLAWAPDVPDRATTSLAACGHLLTVDAFAPVLAAAFAQRLAQWRSGGLPATISAWMERAHAPGTRLTLTEGAHAGLTAGFESLEQDGSLRLRRDDGSMLLVHAGDVRLAGA